MQSILPTELLSRICAHISSQTTLKDFALCSRQFHDVAISHLYYSVALHESQWQPAKYDADYDRFHLRHIISLFVRQPKLASHVRVLSFRRALEFNTDEEPTARLDIETARQLSLEPCIKEAIRNASRSEEEEAQWLQDSARCDGKNDDALLAVLLVTLPGLQCLDLEWDGGQLGQDYGIPRHLIRILSQAKHSDHNLGFPTALQELRDVCWGSADDEYLGELASDFFGLPAIRRLFLHRIESFDYLDGVAYSGKTFLDRYGPTSSHIEHIDAHDCRFNDDEIRDLLRVPKALKTFIYEIGGCGSSDCNVTLSVVHEGLERHKHTLEDLWLDYKSSSALGRIFTLDDDDATTRLRSLREFRALRRLRLAALFLLGECTARVQDDEGTSCASCETRPTLLDVLPPNLDCLHLAHCEDSSLTVLWATLYCIIQDQRNDSQRITQVTLELPRERLLSHVVPVAKLMSAAEKSDVKLTFLDNFGQVDSERHHCSSLHEGRHHCRVHEGRRHCSVHKHVERKWGVDEDIEWAPFSDQRNARPIYEEVDLKSLLMSG